MKAIDRNLFERELSAVRELGSAEDGIQIAIDPVHSVPQHSYTHRTGEIPADDLSVTAHVWYLLNGINARIDPVNIVCDHVDGKVTWVINSWCNQWSPLWSIQKAFADDGELAVINPVKETFDWIYGQLTRGLLVGADQFHTVGSVKGAHLDVRLMQEHIREIHVPGDPVDCQSADTIRADPRSYHLQPNIIDSLCLVSFFSCLTLTSILQCISTTDRYKLNLNTFESFYIPQR